MGTGASSLAKVGLTHNVGKRESARQDLATMGQLVQMKKEQEREEQQAALIEQQYYEQISKEADQMLAGDRKRINERSKSLQGQIRKQIKAFGGSRAKFMASGGLGMLGDYTRNLLDSKEVAQYKENQKNLNELLDIKKKGLGHLLSSRDKLSLEEYNENGTGTITYSGLKSEIKLPPSESFYMGTYATPSEILWYGDNYLKILGNYKIDNPDVPIETMPLQKQQAELLSYTMAEGWTQRGSKTRPLPYGGRGYSTKGSGANAKDRERKMIITQSGELRLVMTKNNNPIGIEDMSNPALADNEYLNDVYGGVTYNKRALVNKTIGEAVLQIATGIGTLGISTLFDWDNNNGYTPRGASDLGKNMSIPLFKTQNGEGYDIMPGNIIQNFVPEDSNNFYLANGAPVNADEMRKGNYTITGSFIGYEMNARGENYLVVDALDDKGKLDTKRNELLYKTDGDGDQPLGKKAMYIAIEDSKGNQYYQKIEYDGTVQESSLGDYIGKERNNLADQYEEADANRDLYNEIGERTTIAIEGQADLEVPIDIFDNNTDFQALVGVYNRWGDGKMRDALMKGFYMTSYDLQTKGGNPNNVTLDGLINQNSFGIFIAGLGLDNRLDDIRLTDIDLLALMEQRILSEAHSEDDKTKARNKLLITKIRNYMTKARSTKSKTKAEQGAEFGFTAGTEWQVAKDFKGPSHSSGGIDINPNKL